MVSLIDLFIPAFLALREGLEATLVIVIILLYLKNTDQQFYYKYVYIGTLLAIFSSILFSVIFLVLLGGFTGTFEEIFEGFTFIVSGIFVVSLVLWMSKEGPKMTMYLEEKIEVSIEKGKIFSISVLTYIIIIREGIELVLLLTGASSVGDLNDILVIFGSTIGLIISGVIGLIIFYGVKKLNLTKFFKITNIILILFAAGLITYGFHEIIEAGLINPIIEEVWNIKNVLPESFPDDNMATPMWLEIIGALFRALFGYNANPSLLEIIIYPILLSTIGFISLSLWKHNSRVLILEQDSPYKIQEKETK